jgi:RNA polymerase sigma-70 factor (ECF subfamily)
MRDQPVQFSDQALVEEILGGSQLAFGLLMKRYERLVYRIAFQHVRTRDGALDIAQNVFLNVHRRLDSYSGAGPLKAWLIRIAYNESLSWLRRHRNDRMTDELTEVNAPVLHSVQEDEVTRMEDQAMIRTELEKLSDRQRLAVSMRYFEDSSLREIAAVLECSEGSVKSILFRSLQKLRNRLTFQRRDEYAQL